MRFLSSRPPLHLTTSVIKQGCYQERIQKGEETLEMQRGCPLSIINPCCYESSFTAREGLVRPVICYSVNHISGEMDLLACPLQRNEGQPLPPRCHLQHDAIVNVNSSRIKQKHSHPETKRRGGRIRRGQSTGFVLSLAALLCCFFVSLA